MSTQEVTGFPLCWPTGRLRTPPCNRRHARFDTSFASARSNLLREIRLLGGKGQIFSSDIPRKADGQPYADAKPKSGDPGIACYFTRNGKQLCFACDCYLTVDDNMQAIALTIAALRGIARWGTGDMMEAAFRGFTALPEASTNSWWIVLGVAMNADREQIRLAYTALCKKWHPDVSGGSADKFRDVQKAYEESGAK